MSYSSFPPRLSQYTSVQTYPIDEKAPLDPALQTMYPYSDALITSKIPYAPHPKHMLDYYPHPVTYTECVDKCDVSCNDKKNPYMCKPWCWQGCGAKFPTSS
jgi:hypothetical protein